jgi:23S rRNA pseudouridine1911/1915/1917 synthase
VAPALGEKGKEAITEYRILQRYAHRSLIEVDLQTGRTHQVRAHLAHLGYPVVGDFLYGKNPSSTRSLGTLALHASELGFIHPISHTQMLFRSKPPRLFRNLIEKVIQKTV